MPFSHARAAGRAGLTAVDGRLRHRRLSPSALVGRATLVARVFGGAMLQLDATGGGGTPYEADGGGQTRREGGRRERKKDLTLKTGEARGRESMPPCARRGGRRRGIICSWLSSERGVARRGMYGPRNNRCFFHMSQRKTPKRQKCKMFQEGVFRQLLFPQQVPKHSG